MLEDTRQKVLSTSERITTLTAELNDGNSKIEEMKAEFNRIVSWSKIFDESPMEVKKMICGYIIKKVSVFRDYRIKIEFNINVEQFLNGIDSIDECDTYELPMAHKLSPRHDHGRGTYQSLIWPVDNIYFPCYTQCISQ